MRSSTIRGWEKSFLNAASSIDAVGPGRIELVGPYPRGADGAVAWLDGPYVNSHLSHMPTITLHYNASCPDCARQASRTARLDWLDPPYPRSPPRSAKSPSARSWSALFRCNTPPHTPISPRNCDALFAYPKYSTARVSVSVSRARVIATKQLLLSSSTSSLRGPFSSDRYHGNTP